MRILISEEQFNVLEKKKLSSYKKLFEKVLNEYMPKKYNWWKGIEIEEIDKLGKNLIIAAVLNVPEDWGEEKWKEFQYDKYFPKNDAWEALDANERDFVSFGDVVSTYEGDEIRESFDKIWSHLTGDFNFYISLSPIFLKFI